MTRVLRALSPKTVGAVYVWLLLIVVFSLANPIFAEYATITQILNQYAVTGLIAMGLLLPLSAGFYDLSVGAVVGLSAMVSAWMLTNVTLNPIVAIGAGLGAALLVGILNSIVLIVLRVDSFIGTLGTSSIITALVIAISNDRVIAFDVFGEFGKLLGIRNFHGLTVPVLLLVITVLVLAYLMEKTAFGRRVYAIGYDVEVARLSGIRVDLLRTVTLLASSLLAGLAGVCAGAAIGAGDPTVGPAYLLPAFAAAFLGATQFRHGRFNPWGTVVAVLLLGTGNVGLLIAGAATWTPSIFSGVVLIVAVALTHGGTSRFSRFRRPRDGSARLEPAASEGPLLVSAESSSEGHEAAPR